MTTRWVVERAVFVSDLSANARLIALTLLAMTDAGNAVVPAQYTPSLSRLVAMTGLSLATVKRALNELENGGWVVRKRPDPVKARAEKERTCYRLVVPEAGLTQSLGGLTQSLGLGSERATGLGSERATSQTCSSRPISQQQSATPIQIVQEATGATEEEAAAIINRLRKERQITNLPGFLRKLAADGDLGHHLTDVRGARVRDADAADRKVRRGLTKCEHGTEGGELIRPDKGQIRCSKCIEAQQFIQPRAPLRLVNQ